MTDNQADATIAELGRRLDDQNKRLDEITREVQALRTLALPHSGDRLKFMAVIFLLVTGMAMLVGIVALIVSG